MSLNGMAKFLMMVFFIAGCQEAGFSSQGANLQNIPKDLMITLERTVCYGFCPEYKLTISADGAVVFEGRRFVKQEGATLKSSISQEQIKQLIAEFERVKYFSLEDNYVNDRRVCETQVTDHPSANTSITINGKTKTIKHYLGCLGPKVPEALSELENKIDEIVNTAQWLPDRK